MCKFRIGSFNADQGCGLDRNSNRAWCYSKLELHKHVIKDCDKAIALSPSTLQAYLYKGANQWAEYHILAQEVLVGAHHVT